MLRAYGKAMPQDDADAARVMGDVKHCENPVPFLPGKKWKSECAKGGWGGLARIPLQVRLAKNGNPGLSEDPACRGPLSAVAEGLVRADHRRAGLCAKDGSARVSPPQHRRCPLARRAQCGGGGRAMAGGPCRPSPVGPRDPPPARR